MNDSQLENVPLAALAATKGVLCRFPEPRFLISGYGCPDSRRPRNGKARFAMNDSQLENVPLAALAATKGILCRSSERRRPSQGPTEIRLFWD